ncbi:MAG: DNA repair protein RecO (recombination protein O) [Candidatus Azotimanducaceae bacterium]|jgi:DNA repair protein RecO (recombination protein O)
MMTSDELQPAYVLHARKYRDTSLIVELLTRHEGRVSAVVRGARSKRGRQQGTWQPFMPLLASCFGQGDLRTVKHAEFLQTAFHLSGEQLLLGLYANELLVRVLGKFEAVPAVFGQYQSLLAVLAAGSVDAALDPRAVNTDDASEPLHRPLMANPARVALRHFELCVLSEMGYGISFAHEAASDRAVQASRRYQFVAGEGFYLLPGSTAADAEGGDYPGEYLLAIAAGEIDSTAIDRCARAVIRVAIGNLLGGRPLNSRELFQRPGYTSSGVTL